MEAYVQALRESGWPTAVDVARSAFRSVGLTDDAAGEVVTAC
jgi:hypothetical protein